MSENDGPEKVVLDGMEKAKFNTTVYYPLVPTVETPPEIINKLIDDGERQDLGNETWALFSHPDQRRFIAGLERRTDSVSTGFGSQSLEAIFELSRSRFDPHDDDAPVNGTILCIVDERTLRDRTVILAEGTTEWANEPNVAVDTKDIDEEFVWRWIRVDMDDILPWLSCAANKALRTFMLKPGNEPGFMENGTFCKADF